MTRPRMPEDLEALRERTTRYRQTHRKEGDVRIDFWMPAEAEAQLQTLMASRKMGRKAMVVTLIAEAAQKQDQSASPDPSPSE